MQDKIIILKNTKNGVIKDTIMSVQDTLRLDIKQELLIPDNATIKTITDPPTGIEYWGLWVAAIGGLIGILAGIKAIKDLFKKSDDQQAQLNELKGIIGAIEAQNSIITDGNSVMRDYFGELQNLISTGSSSGLAEIEQRRFRLSVKPRLYINNSGYAGYSGEIHISLNNRGELAFYDGYEFIEGDAIEIHEWKNPIELPKDGRIQLQGKTMSVHPKDLVFKIKIFYHDQEDFKYESIIEWNKFAKIIETIEL